LTEALPPLDSTSQGPSTSPLSTGGKKRKAIPKENTPCGKILKYIPDYIKYGFISLSFNNQERPIYSACKQMPELVLQMLK
jgi:hypothetical protein